MREIVNAILYQGRTGVQLGCLAVERTLNPAHNALTSASSNPEDEKAISSHSAL